MSFVLVFCHGCETDALMAFVVLIPQQKFLLGFKSLSESIIKTDWCYFFKIYIRSAAWHELEFSHKIV